MKVRIPRENGGGREQMMQRISRLQEDMENKQAELAAKTYEASAGGGAVTAVISGEKKVVSISIDPDAADDMEMLSDMICAAVNEGLSKAEDDANEEMGKLTSGLNIPGMPGF